MPLELRLRDTGLFAACSSFLSVFAVRVDGQWSPNQPGNLPRLSFDIHSINTLLAPPPTSLDSSEPAVLSKCTYLNGNATIQERGLRLLPGWLPS